MSTLTVAHLLWRMRNVHTDSEVVSLPAGGRTRSRRAMTFPEVAGRAQALASTLHDALGVGRGDTVAVLAFNTEEHFETLLAVPTLGAAVNSLNVRLDALALCDQALHPQPAAAVVDREVLVHPVLGENARLLLKTLQDNAVPIVAVGDMTEWTTPGDSVTAFEDLVARHGLRAAGALPLPVDENDTAYWFHTSGTTGAPKTYPVTHRAAMLHTLAQATAGASGLTDADRVLPLAPFFHVNGWGLPLTCAMTGASPVLVGGDLDPSRVAAVMASESVTVGAAVPTVWHDVCTAVARGDAPLPHELREVVSGGAAVPESLVRAIGAVLGATVATAWGMTETMAASSYERSAPSVRAGKPIPLLEMRIRDAQDHHTSATGSGILDVRGEFVIGAEDGDWLDTADVASIDDRGRLTLHDRQRDLVKSGGEWIATADLEQHLCTHRRVHAVAVVAVSDPRWSERPAAFVVLDGRTDPGDVEAELRRHVEARFPRWWIPDRFHFVPDLPTTSVGKIDKRALRRQLEPDPEREALP